MFPVLMIDDEVDLRLPARNLHHAVQGEVIQIPLLPEILIDLSLDKVLVTKKKPRVYLDNSPW